MCCRVSFATSCPFPLSPVCRVHGKKDRANLQKQIRENKRREFLEKRNSGTGSASSFTARCGQRFPLCCRTRSPRCKCRYTHCPEGNSRCLCRLRHSLLLSRKRALPLSPSCVGRTVAACHDRADQA